VKYFPDSMNDEDGGSYIEKLHWENSKVDEVFSMEICQSQNLVSILLIQTVDHNPPILITKKIRTPITYDHVHISACTSTKWLASIQLSISTIEI
jgi:hypothetical protein